MLDIGDSGLSTWHPCVGKYSYEGTWSFLSCPCKSAWSRVFLCSSALRLWEHCQANISVILVFLSARMIMAQNEFLNGPGCNHFHILYHMWPASW